MLEGGLAFGGPKLSQRFRNDSTSTVEGRNIPHLCGLNETHVVRGEMDRWQRKYSSLGKILFNKPLVIK